MLDKKGQYLYKRFSRRGQLFDVGSDHADSCGNKSYSGRNIYYGIDVSPRRFFQGPPLQHCPRLNSQNKLSSLSTRVSIKYSSGVDQRTERTIRSNIIMQCTISTSCGTHSRPTTVASAQRILKPCTDVLSWRARAGSRRRTGGLCRAPGVGPEKGAALGQGFCGAAGDSGPLKSRMYGVLGGTRPQSHSRVCIHGPCHKHFSRTTNTSLKDFSRHAREGRRRQRLAKQRLVCGRLFGTTGRDEALS